MSSGNDVEFDDCKERCQSFCSRFFSLVVAILLDVLTVIYTIGASTLIGSMQSFSNTGFAHFLGFISAIASAIAFTVLHFLPKRAYRMLYLISAILVLSIFLVSHSLGLTAPTVDDCDSLGLLNITKILTEQANNVGNVGYVILNGGNGTVAVGRLGQVLGGCTQSVVTFVTALMIVILEVVALFDTQRMLLTRVRSKTYGERFVEMGIK